LKTDDNNAIGGLEYAYNIAMDRATGTFDPGPAAAAGPNVPVDPALALQFATLLKNFIIEAGYKIELDLRAMPMFTLYEERKRGRQAEVYYRRYYIFLKQNDYAAANAFIRDPHNRDRVLSFLILKLADETEVGFKMNLQELYNSILDRETAAIFNGLYETALKSVKQQKELEEAFAEVKMDGGRKSRRRAKKTRRSVRKNKSRSKGKSICK
jgi:predicted KAP-like P-loop ATPase